MKRKYYQGIFLAFAAVGACLAAMSLSYVGDYPGKLWLHRCNSIEKLHEKAEDYPNVEVDLVFREDGWFDVTHDLDTTFRLSLATYFDHLEENDRCLWLDIKNLNEENAAEALDVLDSLTEHYDIDEERLIVESPSVEALDTFTAEGYYTSLYLKHTDPDELEDHELDAYIDTLQAVADRKAVSAFSFNARWYSTLKKELHRPINLLTWMRRATQFEFFLLPVGHSMIADKQLKVILIKDKGKYHR